MLTYGEYKDVLASVMGKTIAVVYIFEGDRAPGFKHYEVWKGDLVGEWIQAVNELRCMPLIFDTRTFVQKAMDGSLPYIDFVVNLNNGTFNVSTLGLVPSVCAFLDIPCIPCNADSLLAGENKRISNLLAFAQSLNVPVELERHNPQGIFRPLSCGSSIGVVKGEIKGEKETAGIYQEFIPGFDMTTPLLYNPLTLQLEVMPPVAYIPANNDLNWFLGEQQKKMHNGYQKVITSIDQNSKQHYLKFAASLSINTFCRIDARVKCENIEGLHDSINGTICSNSIFFLEINPTPTIKKGINFHTSLEGLTSADAMYRCRKYYSQVIEHSSITGFILSNALIAIQSHV